MDLANPQLEDHPPLTPLTPLTPALSELESLDTDSQHPLTPATMDILLEPADMAVPGGDDSTEEDEDLFERDDTIRLNPDDLVQYETRVAAPANEVEGDDDLFPTTAAPLSEPVGIDASRVPLPRSPSPLEERTIPGPPAGWKSTVSTLARDDTPSALPNGPSVHVPTHPDSSPLVPPNQRRFTARTVSGSQPLQVKGRTVSGTMQYAIHRTNETTRHSLQPTPEPPLPAHSGAEEITDDSNAAGAPPEHMPIGLEDVSTVQQDEEIWMSYVRQQLAALFPDFFDPNEHSQPFDGPGSVIMARAREQADDPGEGGQDSRLDPLRAQEIGWEVIQDRGHRRPWTTNPRVPSVTNVKDEIGGMKDEIERLREVVSGLANGMRDGQRQDEPRHDPGAEIVAQEHPGLEDDSPSVQEADPSGQFTISMTPAGVELIKSIDELIHGLQRPDAVVFNDTNLLALTAAVQKRHSL